jgi:hypothetical protein
MFTPMRNAFHSRVERSDCHRAKVERNRLKVHVLRRMPNFHVDVAYSSRAVFCCRANCGGRRFEDGKHSFRETFFISRIKILRVI